MHTRHRAQCSTLPCAPAGWSLLLECGPGEKVGGLESVTDYHHRTRVCASHFKLLMTLRREDAGERSIKELIRPESQQRSARRRNKCDEPLQRIRRKPHVAQMPPHNTRQCTDLKIKHDNHVMHSAEQLPHGGDLHVGSVLALPQLLDFLHQ